MRRSLIVTIDTEIDKDPHWNIASSGSFHSVLEGIPQRLTPLFETFGVRPTYFLSPEVIENERCVKVLGRLRNVELATHLHPEFVEPERILFPHNMAGKPTNAIQRQYSYEVERQKLANLTGLFSKNFGFQPTAFRAGRYGIGDRSLEFLAQLGYQVDSSVTPGLTWDYKEGFLDFSKWSHHPQWISTPQGKILELPITILPSNGLALLMHNLPLLRRAARFEWLRPSWSSGRQMIRLLQKGDFQICVLMFHNIEITAGASPYAQNERQARRILESLSEVFGFCKESGFEFCTASEVAGYV